MDKLIKRVIIWNIYQCDNCEVNFLIGDIFLVKIDIVWFLMSVKRVILICGGGNGVYCLVGFVFLKFNIKSWVLIIFWWSREVDSEIGIGFIYYCLKWWW